MFGIYLVVYGLVGVVYALSGIFLVERRASSWLWAGWLVSVLLAVGLEALWLVWLDPHTEPKRKRAV